MRYKNYKSSKQVSDLM